MRQAVVASFALAAYRYSSQGYADLSQAAQWDDLIRNRGMNGLLKDSGVERNRFSISMSQSLGRAGSLSLTGVLVHRPVGAVQQSAKRLGGGHRPGILS